MHKNIIKILILLTILLNVANADEHNTVEIYKGDYLVLVIGNYVHQFNTFDTEVHLVGKSINVNIYYDISSQSLKMAENFKNRISPYIASKIKEYKWGDEFEFKVSIYSENMTNQYK